jgi:hypothetical protein
MAHAALLVPCSACFVVLGSVGTSAFGSRTDGVLVHSHLFALSASLSALFVLGFFVLCEAVIVCWAAGLALCVSCSALLAASSVLFLLRKAMVFCATSLVACSAFWVFRKIALSALATLGTSSFAGSWVLGIVRSTIGVAFTVSRSLGAMESAVFTAQALGRIFFIRRAALAARGIVVTLVSAALIVSATLASLHVWLASECAENASNDTSLLDGVRTSHGWPVNKGDIIRSRSDAHFVARRIDHDSIIVAGRAAKTT